MKRFIYLSICISFFVVINQCVFGQTVDIKGIIIDDKTERPIDGAVIRINNFSQTSQA